ncbi:hypothetical protein ACFVZH_07490 [Streptomyces sp. NPDC059534]|uniref:hypothetical protein n=1 Tax=Streptomyces sp. NPDC059534 TaxID=3346859 RepID=UPI00368A6E88
MANDYRDALPSAPHDRPHPHSRPARPPVLPTLQPTERSGRQVPRPASARLVDPYLRIILSALGPRKATAFLTAALKAHQEERAREGTIQLGFCAYLSDRLGESWGRTLAEISAWEAMQAVRRLVRADPEADLGRQLAHGLALALAVASGPAPTTAR